VGLGRAGWLTQVIRGLAGPGGLVLPSPYIYIYREDFIAGADMGHFNLYDLYFSYNYYHIFY
jgi:hypothetical protein